MIHPFYTFDKNEEIGRTNVIFANALEERDIISALDCRRGSSVRRVTFKSNPTSTRDLHISVYALAGACRVPYRMLMGTLWAFAVA